MHLIADHGTVYSREIVKTHELWIRECEVQILKGFLNVSIGRTSRIQMVLFTGKIVAGKCQSAVLRQYG